MIGRRTLLGSTAATVALAPVAIPAGHPDAALIQLCGEHAVNLIAYNEYGGTGPMDAPDPRWDAYRRTRDAIGAAKPQTLDGMIAKARAAKAEAWTPDGSDQVEFSGQAERWAWDLLNDLLAGRAGV